MAQNRAYLVSKPRRLKLRVVIAPFIATPRPCYHLLEPVLSHTLVCRSTPLVHNAKNCKYKHNYSQLLQFACIDCQMGHSLQPSISSTRNDRTTAHSDFHVLLAVRSTCS